MKPLMFADTDALAFKLREGFEKVDILLIAQFVFRQCEKEVVLLRDSIADGQEADSILGLPTRYSFKAMA